MTPTVLPAQVSEEPKGIRNLYLEFYAASSVMNARLTVVVFCLSAVIAGLVVLNIKTNAKASSQPIRVVGIDREGRPQVLGTESLEFHPQEREIKYFLIQFVQRHYSRIRATVKDDYTRSLYFLEDRQAEALIEANKKSNEIESFLAGQGEEIDVKVSKVSIEDLRTSPYRATVDFDKVYYGPTHQETHRESFTANFVFIVRDRVTNDFVPVNPLGLTITYFREDESFSK